jgi:ABC-type dipeptide/oligopeptide/nickel transport system permease component
MLRLILMRLIQVPLVIMAVSLLVFVFLNASGDPVLLLLPFDASPEDVEEMRKALGLDKPLMVRYGIFLWDAIQGDFGVSLRSHQPALSIVLDALPATIELALAAMLVATVISIPLGITAAVKRGGTIDMTATVVSVLGQSMPVFWLGILLIMLFSVTLHWFPVSGRGGISSLILPAVTLGWYMNALMTRMTRTAMLEVLSEPYIITARAKGLPERLVIMKHAFRNARVPIITIWGLQAGTMLTGTVVTETVFSWPGLGRASIYAVAGRDYPVVLASIALFTLIFVTINLVIDLAYFVFDPRIRQN